MCFITHGGVRAYSENKMTDVSLAIAYNRSECTTINFTILSIYRLKFGIFFVCVSFVVVDRHIVQKLVAP